MSTPATPITWATFLAGGQDAARALATLAKDHPTSAGTVIVGTSGLILVIVPGLAVILAIAGLNCIGFGTGGIIGGTAAASAQAAVGNVVAPSLFATLTSAGAGGYGVATISGLTQVVGGAAAGLAGMTGLG